MNLLAPVSSIMTTKLITVSENDPLTKVGEIFDENRIHHVPVVDKGRLIGMISKSDYLFFKRGFNPEATQYEGMRLRTYSAKEIMTKGIAKLEATDKINVSLEVFKENLFHAIPVIEGESLVGILTTLDIIKHLATDKEAVNEYQSK